MQASNQKQIESSNLWLQLREPVLSCHKLNNANNFISIVDQQNTKYKSSKTKSDFIVARGSGLTQKSEN